MNRPASKVALALLFLLCGATPVVAAEPEIDKILVTFDDPGMGNSARAGPVRPGYSRRASSYLVSIGVRRAARDIEREFGLRALDEWPIEPLKVHCIVYAVEGDRDLQEILDRLQSDPRVESAQRMHRFELLVDSAEHPVAAGTLQHSAISLQLDAAHRWSRGGGARVAVIDTGADISHPEISRQIETHRNFVDDSAAGFSADAHGTAIAGIIGASADDDAGIIGVAPDAALTILKACWYTDRQEPAECDSFTLARALSFAIDAGVDVINLSLSGPEDPLLARLLTAAIDGDQIVVAAAPPLAAADASFPASVTGVIVAGTAEADGVGAGAVVRAPGSDILVPVPGGDFDFASGNSLSAAHVSGVVALLVSRKPRLSRNDVTNLLVAAEGLDHRSLSACRALAELMDRRDCPAQDQAPGAMP